VHHQSDGHHRLAQFFGDANKARSIKSEISQKFITVAVLNE
jgi:hypothetical protein